MQFSIARFLHFGKKEAPTGTKRAAVEDDLTRPEIYPESEFGDEANGSWVHRSAHEKAKPE